MAVTVENNLWSLIPEIVVDYLTEIVENDNMIQTICLIPAKLSSRDIQEIVLVNKDGFVKRRAFGFTPVNANLSVSHEDGDLVIKLAV